MVKPDEFRALVDYYKGKITESTLLDKAARVAAEAKLLLEDTSTPAALKEPVVKELLMQERKLTDKLRQIPIAGGVEPPPRDDEGNLMEGLQEGLLKELIKSINMRGQAATPQRTPKREPVTPARPGTSKIPYFEKPFSSSSKTFTSLKRLKLEKLPSTPIISTGRKLLTATLAIPTPKKKATTFEGRPAKKPRQTEAERLKSFGNREPWGKRGWDPVHAYDEVPKTSRKGKGRGKNRPS